MHQLEQGTIYCISNHLFLQIRLSYSRIFCMKLKFSSYLILYNLQVHSCWNVKLWREKDETNRGWRDRSEVQNTSCYSDLGSVPSSYMQITTDCNSFSGVSDPAFWPTWALSIHKVNIRICRPTITHIFSVGISFPGMIKTETNKIQTLVFIFMANLQWRYSIGFKKLFIVLLGYVPDKVFSTSVMSHS